MVAGDIKWFEDRSMPEQLYYLRLEAHHLTIFYGKAQKMLHLLI